MYSVVLFQYFHGIDGIVFLVDACHLASISEAAAELQLLLKDKDLEKLPILILGNKVDKDGALSKDQLVSHLGITANLLASDYIQANKTLARPMELFMCSILMEYGYKEAFHWLLNHV